MTEKTEFKIAQAPTLPDECCARCKFARKFSPGIGVEMLHCVAVPPPCVVIPNAQGFQISTVRRTISDTDYCARFERQPGN